MTVISGLVRISVVGGRTQADLAVPANVPLAALLPDVLAVLRIDSAEPSREAAQEGPRWTLARIGGQTLASDATLAESQIRDGDLLMLTDDAPATPGPIVDDVVAGMAALSGETREPWTAAAARTTAYTIGLLAAGISALAAVTAVVRGDTSSVLWFTTGATSVLVLVAFAGHRIGLDPRTSAVASTAATAFAAAAGFAAGSGTASQVALTGIATTAVAAVGHRATGRATAVHTSIATVGGLTAVIGACVALWDLSLPALGAGAAALGVCTLLAAGRLSIAAAGLPLPPVPVAAPTVTDPAAERSVVEGVDALGPIAPDPLGAIADLALGDLTALARRSASAASHLTGIVSGATAFTVTATVITAATAELAWTPLVYCLAVASALLTRGRVHADRMQSTSLIVGSAMCVAGGVAAAAWTAHSSSAAIAAMIGAAEVGCVALIAGTLVPAQTYSPLQVRAAEIAQYAVLVCLFPLLLWVLDAYRLVREL
ncbi:type VII secretion integral membrane protein EccD [Gordonia zhaorongruii]|uniref:type VII secretion integral membrane protein EccD n=1 Tax=Gordonia zhaorongruii TaxID=2597659 RepID=UPI0011816122|nr:type VII secretion integral membrane protein EccD [Gordonia zhaorongruii]